MSTYEKLDTINDSLNDIKTAIISKGVTPSGNITTYAQAIEDIPTGSGGVGIAREVSSQGVYQMPTSSFSFSLPSNVTDVGSNALQYAFYGCTGLTSIDLSSLTSISGYKALNYAFYGCTGLTGALDLSNLTSVSAQNAFQATFQNCTGLTSVDLSGLTTVYGGGSACSSTFQGCTGLTSADLSNLTSILFTNGCNSLFWGCTSLTSMSFPKLTDISASNALNNAFKASGITTLSFPALTSTSFGSFTDQFSWMLYDVTGCTVHFPSNLQSVIGSWTDVTTGFRGTNTTVLFDLPATT